jgi:hypothetical protein
MPFPPTLLVDAFMNTRSPDDPENVRYAVSLPPESVTDTPVPSVVIVP